MNKRLPAAICAAMFALTAPAMAGDQKPAELPPGLDDAARKAMEGKGAATPGKPDYYGQVSPLIDKCEGGLPPECPEGCIPDAANKKCVPEVVVPADLGQRPPGSM